MSSLFEQALCHGCSVVFLVFKAGLQGVITIVVTNLVIRPFNASKILRPQGFEGFTWPTGSVDLEIGCGVGLHPLKRSLEYPHRKLIAIEHTATRFQKFWTRYQKHGAPKNLFPIHAEAKAWITHFVPDQSVENIFILYPNPYPKARDLNKRWHAMPFMNLLLEKLKPGGRLTLATNILEYRDQAKDYFERVWGLELVVASQVLKEIKPRTHFEKKYLLRDQICYNLIFGKL